VCCGKRNLRATPQAVLRTPLHEENDFNMKGLLVMSPCQPRCADIDPHRRAAVNTHVVRPTYRRCPPMMTSPAVYAMPTADRLTQIVT